MRIFQGAQMQFFAIAIALIFFCCDARAAVSLAPPTAGRREIFLKPLNITARYNVRWGVFTLGRLIVTAKEDMTSYQMQFDIKTKGLAEWFAKTRGVTSAEGFKSEAGDYLPDNYHSWNKSRKEKREVRLKYNDEGGLATRDRIPMDDPNWRPEVPEDLLLDAYDPVTAFLNLRSMLLENFKIKISETPIKAYDGRRLAEFTVRAINAGTKQVHGKIIPVINTVVIRRPMNGYTPKELKKYDDGDPTVHAYFAANGVLMPLVVEVALRFGTLKLEIDEDSLPQLLDEDS